MRPDAAGIALGLFLGLLVVGGAWAFSRARTEAPMPPLLMQRDTTWVFPSSTGVTCLAMDDPGTEAFVCSEVAP